MMVIDPCPASLYLAEPVPANIRQPVRPTTPSTSHERIAAPRASARPLAYLGFGTVPLYRDAPKLMTTAAESLLSAGYEVLVTTGDPVLARELAALAPDRVQVETWLSLPSVFARCALVACHGGAGTVLTALAAGVPLLLLPRGAPSQMRMSEACRARGVARVVGPDATTRSELDGALAAIGQDDRYRTTAREMATELAAMPSAAETVRRLYALSEPTIP
jgi:UDP:flavonoid glycosyltransferase YjiC (YdhE family)